MSLGTLYTIDVQTKGRIIKAVAAFADVKYDNPTDYKHFDTNLKPEFKSKFPHAKIPSWEGKDGFKVFEWIAIAQYLASKGPNSGLLGSTPEDSAHVTQWVHLAEAELDDHRATISFMLNGILPYFKPLHLDRITRQNRTLDTLESHISTRTYFVGERITLADLAIAGFIHHSCKVTIDTEVRKKIPGLLRHANTIIHHPKLKGLFEEIEELPKALQYVAPAKEKKPAAAAPEKKEEKKEKKEKKKDDDDEDEPLAPPEPKAKNPLADLPKSSFDLEQFKREYSNKDTRGAGGALEWFYQNFDKEGYSVWRFDFKYNDELTQVFMSSNQVGGFFERLDASRKYVFGSGGVLGEQGNSAIAGVFIVRGQKIEGTIDVAPDWESYAYKKLDLDNEEDKKYFEGALAWDLEVDGRKWNQGKNFK